MSLVLFLITLVAAAIGTTAALWLQANVSIDIGGMTSAQVDALITALAWFLICFVVYFAASKLKDVKSFKLVSLKFFLTWAFVCAGVIIGTILYILIDQGSVSIKSNDLFNWFLLALPLALGPTGAASMGLRD